MCFEVQVQIFWGIKGWVRQMREIIATGKSQEEIRDQYSNEWSCSPERLILEVIDKPGVFNRLWKVKVVLPDDPANGITSEDTKISFDGVRYLIYPGDKVESIVPFSLAGTLMNQGKEISEEFKVQNGDTFEFYPEVKQGGLTWNIEVLSEGSKALAKVKHEHAGRFVLAKEIPIVSRLMLERFVSWEPTDETSDIPNEGELNRELAEKGIIYGVKPNIWVDFLTVDGRGEIVIAESTPVIQTVQPQLIDFVGEPVFQEDDDEDKIDFFACKLKICQKDEVLARKVPGKEGTPGMNILGNPLPADKLKDFNFRVKKNVYLSGDGLEVRASCAGSPVRINDNTYLVENAYILSKDVDLATGSIDFPGDVHIGQDVKDGFYVYSGGKIKVQGSVSGANIKAETGLIVLNNIIASKIIVGEKHVFRSQLFNGLQEINEELSQCVTQVEQLQQVSGNSNVGQLLKLILEKNFKELPRKAEELQKILGFKDPECVTKELEVAVQTLAHFLIGMGPLQLKDMNYLKSALRVISFFLTTKENLIPENVACETNYIQNSSIDCAGDFLCKKGIYNSTVNIEGNLKIHGVCRGGEINCSGDIYIWELGGATMSATTIRAGKNSRLSIDYCHSNIKIYVGKELVRIDEPVQKVEIYRDRAILQVERLKWDGKH